MRIMFVDSWILHADLPETEQKAYGIWVATEQSRKSDEGLREIFSGRLWSVWISEWLRSRSVGSRIGTGSQRNNFNLWRHREHEKYTWSRVRAGHELYQTSGTLGLTLLGKVEYQEPIME